MQKKILTILIAILIIMFMVNTYSCRENSDDVLTYAYNDPMNFVEAKSSLEGQFKAIWTAMNCNYPIWDYEEEHGLNWDNVYDTYVPKFRELDKLYSKDNPVPDNILVSIYDSIFTTLHDGHMQLYVQNIHTGKKAYSLSSRLNILIDFISYIITSPSLEYYKASNQVSDYEETSGYIYGKFNEGIVYYRLPEFGLFEAFANQKTDEEAEKICNLWNKWFDTIKQMHSSGQLKGVIIDLRNNPGGNANDYQYVLGALQDGKEKK